ncbi:MAG: XdhC family protein [Oscillospiraceae bacterium]
MKALLHSLLEAAALGRSVVLCTVVHSGGSAPRSAGAHMAVFADGSTRGTVGGGRLELLAAKEGLALLQRQTSALRAYDLSEREGGIGMACGGNVIVSYLYLGPEQADFMRAMAAAFDATAPCWLKLVIAGDGRTDVSLSTGRTVPCARPSRSGCRERLLFIPSRSRSRGASISSARAMSGRRSCRCWNMSALP